MNRRLALLRDWSTTMSTDDPDETARPLWAQIAAEVDAYLTIDEPAPPDDTEPLF